jgi:hypothetical protein
VWVRLGDSTANAVPKAVRNKAVNGEEMGRKKQEIVTSQRREHYFRQRLRDAKEEQVAAWRGRAN